MLDENTIASLKAEHGELFMIETTEEHAADLFIVCKLKQLHVHYDAFQAAVADEDANRMGAIKNFLRDVVVYPERSELNARFERFPALPLTYYKSVAAEAGAALKTRTKKL
jgi:hypothetical protein